MCVRSTRFLNQRDQICMTNFFYKTVQNDSYPLTGVEQCLLWRMQPSNLGYFQCEIGQDVSLSCMLPPILSSYSLS